MKYLETEVLLKSIDANIEYQEMIKQMIKEVDTFANSFKDDYNLISEWGHRYFCNSDGGKLIFDLNKPHEHVCEACGKVYQGLPYDGIWTYIYRNEAILTVWKSALLYKVTKERKYFNYLIDISSYYLDNYTKFKLHNKEQKTFESYETMSWGAGRIMPQGLNEAIITVRLFNALQIVKDELDEKYLEKLNLFSSELFKLLKPQVDKIHNISCWKNSALGIVGLFLGNQEIIDFVFKDTFNVFNQIASGITKDYFWFEGSIHYNFFTLEGLINLLLFSEVYDYSWPVESKKIIENMFIAAYEYAFDNHVLPNPNDGWPNINLKTYSYIYTVGAKIFGENSTVGNILKNIETNSTIRSKLPLSKPYYYNNQIPLERLVLIPAIALDKRTKQPHASKNFESSQYAIIKKENINVFLKYGHNGPSHAHPDKMNIEIMVDDKMLTRDLSNAGYGVELCDEWHRATSSHNTVVINGLNQLSTRHGEVIDFSSDKIIATAKNVYTVDSNIDIVKMKESLNNDEVITFLTRKLGLSKEEAREVVLSETDLTNTINEIINNSNEIDYTRKLKIKNQGIIDEFLVNSNEVVVMDYFFHSEAVLINEKNFKFNKVSLGFDTGGYQHINDVKKVLTTENEITLEWLLGSTKLVSIINLEGKEMFIAKTYDNPITEHRRTSIILRSQSLTTLFKIEWKIIKGGV